MAVTLFMGGTLSVIAKAADLPLVWTDDSGIEVSIESQTVELRWKRETESPDDWALMASLLEPHLLALSLDRRIPFKVDWQIRRLERDDGSRGFVSARGFRPSFDPVEPFSSSRWTKTASTDWTFGLALMQYRDALSLVELDPRGAMTLAYVAAELIVAELNGGSSKESDWTRAAQELAFDPESMMALYHSFQIARHANPTIALKRLAERSAETVGPLDCLYRTGEVLKAYGERISPRTE